MFTKKDLVSTSLLESHRAEEKPQGPWNDQWIPAHCCCTCESSKARQCTWSLCKGSHCWVGRDCGWWVGLLLTVQVQAKNGVMEEHSWMQLVSDVMIETFYQIIVTCENPRYWSQSQLWYHNHSIPECLLSFIISFVPEYVLATEVPDGCVAGGCCLVVSMECTCCDGDRFYLC